ncbi:Csu type fimbrial protein [Biostraticola tofi]|uniref:hypothetical protein n=1 Tax=Biostraticola tofi TaxID=466109 RepID=UPI00104E4346|nr:hypothetical protein [Biostraticola tofi]
MANVCLAANAQSGTVVVPLTVTLTVTNDCITTVANDLRFGSAAPILQPSGEDPAASGYAAGGRLSG